MSTEEKPAKPQNSTVRVLKVQNYRLTWPAMFASAMGRMMWTFVSGYLIFQLTKSSLLTQMVAVAFSAPQFLLGVFSGTLADAYDRRKVMFWSLLLMSIATFITAILAFLGMATAWNILAFSAVFGVLFTLNNVTRRTFTFDVVGRDLLPSAMAMDNIGMTMGNILGPMIGGLLLDLAPGNPMRGAAWTFLAIGAAYAAATVLLFYVKPDWKQSKIPLSVGSALGNTTEGLKVVATSKVLIGILGVTVLFNLVYPPSRSLIPAFQPVLNITATQLGILGAASGIGALVGATYLTTRGTIKRQSLYYWTGSALSCGLLAVFASTDNYGVALVSLVVGGIGQAWFGTMQATLVMLSVPDNMRGRVMGILSMAIGIQTLGSLVMGILAEALGPGPALLAMAVAGTISTFIWVSIFKEMRKV